jgi:hypothetical protein
LKTTDPAGLFEERPEREQASLQEKVKGQALQSGTPNRCFPEYERASSRIYIFWKQYIKHRSVIIWQK